MLIAADRGLVSRTLAGAALGWGTAWWCATRHRASVADVQWILAEEARCGVARGWTGWWRASDVARGGAATDIQGTGTGVGVLVLRIDVTWLVPLLIRGTSEGRNCVVADLQ